jgi:cytoplasmic iron level regulating protein YaaA (DUF328/UPF0246 family)
MLFVISPAKTLDFTPPDPALPATRPQLGRDTAALAAVAKTQTPADLKRLMDISDDLAALNAARFKAFSTRGRRSDVQAALAFAGDVYRGLKARELDAEALAWAQGRLRILSGLYGVLRPLDRIQPYRLEMGVRLANPRGETLYDFWRADVAKTLAAATRGHADKTVVNLASQEYFGAVDVKALKRPVLTCLFKQDKDGQITQPSFYAKTARGLMARFAIDERVEHKDDLKRFDREGYRFRPDLSTTAEWVFVRPHP